MIKILHVVIDNNIGGIQNRLLQTVEKLNEKDIESIILTPATNGQFSEDARKKGIKVCQASIQSPRLNNSTANVLRNFFWLINFPLGVLQTITVIKKEKIQIVHANGLFSLHAVIAGIILNREICWHLISTIYPTYLVKLLRPLFFEKKVHTIFVTYNTIEYYLGSKRDSAEFRVIFEPVDVNFFSKDNELAKNGNSFLKQYTIKDDTQVIGFIGNINPQKGLEYFITAASEVKKQYSGNLKFLIIGKMPKGHEKYYLKLQTLVAELEISDNIIFTGKIEDIRPILCHVDIFLMTSITEGTPIVILEAMSMEIPIIAPDVGGISDQIIDGKTGIVTIPKNIKSTSDALIFLLKNPNVRLEMGKEGRERVKKQFSLEKCVAEHYKLYNNIFRTKLIYKNKNQVRK